MDSVYIDNKFLKKYSCEKDLSFETVNDLNARIHKAMLIGNALRYKRDGTAVLEGNQKIVIVSTKQIVLDIPRQDSVFKETSYNIIDMSNTTVETLETLFHGIPAWKINLGNIQVLRKEKMNHTFALCRYLEEVNFGQVDLDNITNFEYTFAYCKRLENIDLNKYTFKKAKYTQAMFKGCEKIKQLRLNNFSPCELKNTSEMFSGCKSLKAIELENYKYQQLIRGDNVFNGVSGCKVLESEDIICV